MLMVSVLLLLSPCGGEEDFTHARAVRAKALQSSPTQLGSGSAEGLGGKGSCTEGSAKLPHRIWVTTERSQLGEEG